MEAAEQKLTAQITAIQAQVEGRETHVGSHHFQSLEDVIEFVGKCGGQGFHHLFFDPVHLLVELCSQAATYDVALNEELARTKTGLSPAQIRHSYPFGVVFPPVLTGSAKEMSEKEADAQSAVDPAAVLK